MKPGVERRKIVDTVDKDELDESEMPAPVCYYIIDGNENNLFNLEPLSHQIMVNSIFIFYELKFFSNKML